jgi:hypothetical protein
MDKTLKIAILLTAVDRMSEVVSHAVEKSQKRFAKMANFSRGLNAAGSLAITGGTASLEFLEKTLSAAEENEIATKRLGMVFSHSIKNYQGAAAASQKYASQLEMQIGLEDEEIMAVQSKLGIFKQVATEANIANGVFNRATKAAFDLQAAGFGDASTSIVKLGKVLDNPIKSMNSLSKVGIIFNKVEQDKIKKLVQSGKMFDAQNMILKKVEARVGGVAAATAPATKKMAVAWSEVMESIGHTLLPLLTRLANFMVNSLIPKVQAFIEEHPQLVKWLGIAAVSLLGLGIAMKVVAAAMTLVQIASGPIGWIIMGIAALAFVLIKYWKPISKYFSDLWNFVKAIFVNTWNWIKNIFLKYTPAGLIFRNWDKIKAFFSGIWNFVKGIFSGTWNWIKGLFEKYSPVAIIYRNWDKIKAFFSNLWGNVKGIFSSVWDWIMGLGKKFFNAGKNIVTSIWNGIKALINKPIEAVKKMVGKIRNLLPFSPAKEGPLRDIHKIKLVETIAASINSAPLIKAMRGVVGDVSGYGSPRPVGVGAKDRRRKCFRSLCPNDPWRKQNRYSGRIKKAFQRACRYD